MKEPDKKKKSSYFSFFSKYSLYGLILILLSVIVDQWFKSENCFLVKVFTSILATVGTAFMVGAVFDFSKNSKAFTDFVSDILQNIVVSKDFLTKLNQEEKRKSLELILKPSDIQMEQCSSIDMYYKKSLNNIMELYNKQFKTDLILNLEAKKEATTGSDKRIVIRGTMSHKIYKVNGCFPNIKTSFEKDDCGMPKTYVIPTEGGEKEELNVDCQPSSEEGIKSVYETRIPEKFNQYPYLLLYREIEERGYDHWTNFHWTSLTPCDGITFTLKCFDDIIIKDHLIFDEKSLYHVELSEDNKTIIILSNSWLDPYTGFTITVGDNDRLG